MAVQPGLCGTWSETPKTGFLTTRLKLLRAGGGEGASDCTSSCPLLIFSHLFSEQRVQTRLEDKEM